MTVSRLRQELTDQELIAFAAFYELKEDRERQAAERSRSQM
tara:strand:+ start:1289 stop:1411 length:123 start_codon:yes stop_codon:yes gene_type:complete